MSHRPKEYEAVLGALPRGKPISDGQVRRARHFAHYFFFRRMIPIGFARRNPHLVPVAYDVETLDQLKPGADPGLDLICDGILSGRPFVYGPDVS